MRLTSDQMRAPLRDDDAFARWYVENVMKVHAPEHYFAVSPEGRLEMTVNGRAHAARFGIADIESQMHFITLMWKLGAGFFRHPGFREVAEDPALDGPAKISAFYEVPRERAIDAITQPDDRWWYPQTIPPAERLA